MCLVSYGKSFEMPLAVATNILHHVKIIRCRFVRNFIRIFEHQCHKDQTGRQVFVFKWNKKWTTAYFYFKSNSAQIN